MISLHFPIGGTLRLTQGAHVVGSVASVAPAEHELGAPEAHEPDAADLACVKQSV